MRSIRHTLSTLDPPALAALCPRLAWVDDPDTPELAAGERALWRGTALVRVHGAVGAADGRPLRTSDDPLARLVALAAGAGPLAVTAHRVTGVLRPTPDRPALAYDLAWDDVDDVSSAPSGGVLLLATTLLGGLTLDPIGSVHVPLGVEAG